MTSVSSEAEPPLAGCLVLDFSQFLAGPVAALRLADLGARVIKVERPGVGELGRQLAFAGAQSDGDTVSFQIMNRNKESVVADLKDPADLARIRGLVARADVLIQNFRPGVIERIGLDYDTVAGTNPRLVYGSISGYGGAGPWRELPGQDLLAQATAGLPWLNGDHDQGPVPVGLSVADLLGSSHLATGILALLLRRERTGRGGLVETSLMEGMLDLQFELISARLNDDTVRVHRGGDHSASAFLAAPYGVYPTRDGHLAIAMNPVPQLGALLELPGLAGLHDPATWWSRRDEIEDALARRLVERTTRHWLDRLVPAGIWCAEVLNLEQLVTHPGFEALAMTQVTRREGLDGDEHRLVTVRSPLRVDGQLLTSERGAPRLGEHTGAVFAEFDVGDPGPPADGSETTT